MPAQWPLLAAVLLALAGLPSPATAAFNRSHFTIPMLLNSGTSPNNLGNYDGCLGLPRTHHCVVSLEPTPPALSPNQTFWLAAPLTLVGVCAPADCTAEDLRRASLQVLSLLNPMLPSILGPSAAAMLKAGRVEVACSEDRLALGSDPVACVMVCMTAVLLALVVAATAWEWYRGRPAPSSAAAAGSRRQITPEAPPPTPRAGRWLAVFSAVRNGRDLFAHRSSATDFLNGLRVFSIAWVVLGHVAVFTKPSWANLSRVDSILGNYSMTFLFGAFFAVDTFFFMSGFLQAFIMPPYLMRLRSRVLHGLPYVYLLRWLRISPLLLFVIFAWRMARFMGDGPAFYHYQRSTEWLHCEQYWWATALYLNNLYPARNLVCLGWTWYLSNDWQYFLLTGPLLLWYTYGSKQQVVAFLGALLLGCVCLGAEARLSVMNDSYFRPWNRCAPYLWGVLAALGLQRLKQHRAAQLTAATLQYAAAADLDSSCAETDPFFGEPRPARWLTAMSYAVHNAALRRLGYACAAGLMWGGVTLSWLKYKAEWAVLYGRTDLHPWPEWCDRLYGAYYVFAWGLALALLIVPWGMGYGGYVRALLEHPLYTPLARLTYGVYLVHPLVILYTTWQFRSYPTWATAEVATIYLGQLGLATLASLVLYFLVEKPVANAVALLAPEKRGANAAGAAG